MTYVYRVQDADGRGPFKPGLSAQWADPFLAPGMENLPTWGAEFGWDLIKREGRHGEHYGSAVRTIQALNRWFTLDEQRRLDALGYRPVRLAADRILAESPNQLVFARRKPLRRGGKVQPWPGVPAAVAPTSAQQSPLQLDIEDAIRAAGDAA